MVKELNKKWGKRIKVLHGGDYKNELEAYTGCEGEGKLI
jgi:hypothetical protein